MTFTQEFTRRFCFSLFSLTALLLSACSQETEVVQAPAEPEPAPVAELAPLTVSGSYWIELSPVLAAAHEYYPVDMTIAEGGINRMLSGDVDMATNAETQLLRTSVENPDLRIIMTVTESFYRLVARRSAGIESIEDLKGKRVMTPLFTSAGYYLIAMLESVGLTQEDVEIVPFPGGAGDAKRGMELMAEALANGDVDAISIWEPTPEDAMHMLGDDGIILQDKSVYREVFNLHAWATDLADADKRAAIVEFVRAVAAGTEALNNDPEPFLPLISEYTTYSHEQITASLPEMDFPVQIIPDMLDVLEREEAWIARNSDREARPRAELAELIDYSVLEEALSSD